jgi:hypothetical protein
LSPTLTLISFTTPAWLEGISMEALSLHGDEGLVHGHGVAGVDQQFDHAHFGEVADIGHLDIDEAHMRSYLGFCLCAA